MPAIKQAKSYFYETVWDTDLTSLPVWRARLTFLLRLVHAVTRDLAEGQITLRAMSLVYTTLLSLVPLLAVSFSVLKAFGVHNQIEPLLLGFLAPLGEQGEEITSTVIDFVENIKVGVLGAIGLGFLFYTVTALVQKVELAFNFTWRVKRPRPLVQRFSQYLSVLTVGPVLVFSALGITASLMNTSIVQALVVIEPVGTIVAVVGKLIPYMLIIAAFTFIYAFIPNTRVQFTSALAGGAAAGVLWQSTGWAFASFIVGSIKYTAIYSGFAIIILVMIWLYLSWLILLVGGSFAFYHQHPEYMRMHKHDLRLSNRIKEKIAFLVMTAIARNYYRNQPAWTVEALAQHVGTPSGAIEIVINAIEQHGLIQQTANEPPRYLPARALENIPIKELLDAVRAADEDTNRDAAQFPANPVVDEMMDTMDRALNDALQGKTIKDLAGCSTDESATRTQATRPQKPQSVR